MRDNERYRRLNFAFMIKKELIVRFFGVSYPLGMVLFFSEEKKLLATTAQQCQRAKSSEQCGTRLWNGAERDVVAAKE